MSKQTFPMHSITQAQDWAVFGLRLLYVLGLSILIHSGGTTNWQTPPDQNLVVAIVASLIASLVLLVFVLIPSIHEHANWAVIIGDWVIIGAFAPFIQDNSMLVLILLSAVLLTGLIRLGSTWGAIDVIVGLLVFAAVVVYTQNGSTTLATQFNRYGLPLASVAVLAGGMGTMMHYRLRSFEDRHAALSTTAEERHQLVQDLEQRTSAITEMAQQLSSSLNYRRVLEVALHVGRLALKNPDNNTKSLILLFRPEDNHLYTINGLGISRHDKGRTTPGAKGLINDALTICEPIFGGAIRKDPELRNFASLRNVRSTVVVPLRAGYDNYGVMIFASNTPDAFSEDYRSFLEAIGIQTTIALQNASLYQNLLTEKERIVEVEKEARKRLARDLHDGPTQTISAIAMRIGIIQMMLKRTPAEVPSELKKIEELAYQTTSEIRLMLFALRPLALEEEGGIRGALDQLADKYEAVYEQNVEVVVSERAESLLTEAQSETMFSIAQEAVNNARKHAQAPLVTVRVTTFEDTVMFEIIDDGKGFDVDKEVDAAVDRNSLGMRNLYELAELLDGTLSIESSPGQGTHITILIPVDHARVNGRKRKGAGQRDRFTLTTMR